MILSEFNRNGQQLDNYPPSRDTIENFSSVYSHLVDEGWKEIGSGYYSSVLARDDKNFVIKINEKYDKSFAYFVFLIHKFPNKHFPVISNVKLFKGKDGKKFYAYFIEKLEIYNLNNESALSIVRGVYRMAKNIKNGYEPYDGVNEFSTMYFQNNPEMVEAITVIAKYGKGSIDIGLNNCMKRSDNTFVITDPLAFGGSNE